MIVFKDHGVGKKSFLTVNPLPILNTWRHVFSMGVGKKIFSDIKPPPILNTCTIRQNLVTIYWHNVYFFAFILPHVNTN